MTTSSLKEEVLQIQDEIMALMQQFIENEIQTGQGIISLAAKEAILEAAEEIKLEQGVI